MNGVCNCILCLRNVTKVQRKKACLSNCQVLLLFKICNINQKLKETRIRTTTTTTTKSILRPLPQYLLAVKNPDKMQQNVYVVPKYSLTVRGFSGLNLPNRWNVSSKVIRCLFNPLINSIKSTLLTFRESIFKWCTSIQSFDTHRNKISQV